MFKCPYCNKEYTIKKCFDTHRFKCEMLCSNSKVKKEFIERLDSMPSREQIGYLLPKLYLKIETLEKEVKQLKKLLSFKENKKKDVIEWLNENSVNNKDILDWITNDVDVDSNNLNKMFEVGFLEGIKILIKDKFDNRHDIPIKCFEHKTNVIYVYSEGSWVLLNNESLNRIITKIHKKYMKLLNTWKESIPNVLGTDIFLKNYNQVFKKKDSNLNNIREAIFNKLHYKVDGLA